MKEFTVYHARGAILGSYRADAYTVRQGNVLALNDDKSKAKVLICLGPGMVVEIDSASEPLAPSAQLEMFPLNAHGEQL